MSIIFGAQACGFGPVSKMVSLASNFKSINKVFIGNNIALQFVQKQRRIFTQTHNSETYIDKKNVATNHDIVVWSNCHGSQFSISVFFIRKTVLFY